MSSAPPHSLLTQSQHAAEAKLAVNGDGFGFAWYAEGPAPGLYRDVLPAWADENLLNLCRMVRSRLFIAHIRASTMGETSRTNCHPFTHGRWSFCHNGQVPQFPRMRRAWEAALSDALYAARRGTTDSEMLFLMLLANGLREDPVQAFRALIRTIDASAREGAARLTCVFSDGETLYGLRHASDNRSPTLYLSESFSGGRALASEPLCGDASTWRIVPADTLCAVSRDGRVTMTVLQRDRQVA